MCLAKCRTFDPTCPGCKLFARDVNYRAACLGLGIRSPDVPDGVTFAHAPAQMRASRPPKPVPCTAGTELKKLVASLGVDANAQPTAGKLGCGSCADMAAQMNTNGIEWCRANVGRIADQLRTNAKAKGWGTFAKAGAWAVLTGVAFKVNPTDPYPGLVEEAIRRAEAQ